MYFKCLELLGFKSFAEKTILNFEPGVTAIIGPNGCGKSNIADAIRWVLGEQSAKSLRASNMEDVIFNGTDTQEPINFAEVSLILSNEKRILPIDYDEVTISRRVFRSGDTEYLLNKTPVRLRDIAELLMGTGIGAESYSIIEQGKMDLILSSRPEDRRYVFEEASGITKYKSKKKEALRKLEQTEANLLRINDIIQEVKRQISSIERQARKAEKYKADFEKLKEMEVVLSCLEFRNLKTQEAKYVVESGDLKQRAQDTESDGKNISAKISDYRLALDELNQKIASLKAKSAEMTGSLEMNTHKITIDRERIEEAKALEGSLNEEIKSVKEKISNAAALIEGLKKDLAGIADKKATGERTLAEKETLLATLAREISMTEEKVKTCKVQTVDYLARETRIKNDLIKIGADIQNRRSRERRLVAEKETVEKELNAAREELEAVAKEFDAAQDKAASLRSELEAKTGAVETLAAEIKTVENDRVRREQERAAVKSKKEFLEDLIKRHEGFKAAVKVLLARREGPQKGILGVLADAIKVEKGYEDAVNTFLGDDAQVIVVEKDADILESIDYLRENRLGKASFVSLETLGRFSATPSARRIDRCTPLKNFVKAKAGFESVIEHFFSNAYMVDSLENALANQSASPSATFVTKTGLIYDSRGKMCGGSASDKDESLIIGRHDRRESLEAELKKLEGEIERFSKEAELKNAKSDILKEELNSTGEAVHAEEINLANIKVKKDSREETANKLKEEVEVLGLELDETRGAVDELAKKGEALNAELNDIEKESSALNLFINESQTMMANKREAREALSLKLATMRAENQAIDKEWENITGNLKKEKAILTESEETLRVKGELSRDSAEKARSFSEEIAALEARNSDISGGLEILSEELSKVEKERSDAADKLGICEIQLKEREGETEHLRNQIRDLDVKLAETNYKKASLKERINQAYKTDIETLHMELDDNTDMDALRGQVGEIKEKLDKMGPVNLVAIEEHKELEERHSFLVHQQEDLLNAKDSLLKAIQKINKTTKELFMDTFQKIQLEFKNFFRLLFGGGQAEVVLMDEQDVLESGIEIIVRPPGKKLQNITLLSGGEKALTAIALLFAVFKVKPSPFCVLDEIDAPLDESNVGRFSNVLKDFLKMSQFIIITHNKRTIELADVMYGITMQERGVSKVVSVKFSEKEGIPRKAVTVPQPA